MTAYLNYLIEVNVGLLALGILYFLLLNQETNFKFKRGFLLTGIGASLLFPLVNFGSSPAIPSIGQLFTAYLLPEMTIESEAAASGFFSLTASSVVKWLYFSVTILISGNLILKIARIVLHIQKTEASLYEGKFRIAESDLRLPTFSFFHFIFIGNVSAFSREEKEQIIQHEIAHSKNYHSLDILVVELIKTVFWFNPVVYYFKSVFHSIHEFQADQAATNHEDVDQYCNLLARVALMSADFPIANHFNNSLILKRITMMKTLKTKIKKWKLMTLASFVAALFLFDACQDQLKTGESFVPSDKVYETVDEMASPVGGMPEFFGYIADNLKYPEQARKMGIEGKVFVEFTVKQDGSIADVKVKEGIGAGCDMEAVRVIADAPKWNAARNEGKPVNQKLVLPITFKMN